MLRTLLASLVVASLCVGCGKSESSNELLPAPDAAGDATADVAWGDATLDAAQPETAPPDAAKEAGSEAAADAGCPPGTELDGGQCVPASPCHPETCSHHGTCSDSGGQAVCACDTGWAPPDCSKCATGWHDDGKGGCTQDPCTPNPCLSPDKTCKVSGSTYECVCKAGTHDEGGACVPDTTCGPTTCSGHGTCTDGGGSVSCACSAGWTGKACDQCDSTGGYHPDGNGGCTTDPCIPNPCKEDHKSVCSSPSQGVATCSCDAGYHEQSGACVADQTCLPNTCSGHGACSVQGGLVVCACDNGYAGAACELCASGWHDDGAGGCTNDPCKPNPCSTPHQSVCSAQGTAHTCSCDSGYHDDGAGGCSDDPCVPNVCLAQNKACQVVGGVAQCYTPQCDDQNPCTSDAVSGGACQNTPLPNGTTCQTSLCKSGETCSSGQCTGGAPLSCDDSNPCTADSCDIAVGCKHVQDNSLVPNDGIDCTVDTCLNGVAQHPPSNALCDDAKWCTGMELCDPGHPQSNTHGCRATNVPQPPAGAGGCQTYGPCDEGSHTFPLIASAPGTPCNDGIPCTTQDQCNAQGECKGVAGALCNGGCAGSTGFNGDLDIPVATVEGTITLAGGALPSTNTDYDGAEIYLVSKDTSAAHDIGGYRYTYSGGTYALYAGYYGGKVLAGVYDVLYRRYWDSTYNTVSRTTSDKTHVAGYRHLATNVVIGAGKNTLSLDIPVADVGGTITLGGAALPATNTDYDGADIYLVAQDTGAAHHIGGYRYTYSGGTYVLYPGYYGGKVLAGTYDVLYRRYWDSQYNTTSRTTIDKTHVAGYRKLATGVVLQPGSNALNLDIPVATVGGTITLAGAPLPATNTDYDGAEIYLVSKDTGAAHNIGGYRYTYSGGTYVLYAGYYGGKVLAGTYDVLYRRYWDSQYDTVSRTTVDKTHVAGYRLLASNVLIAPGDNTLNLDIPVATVSGTITLGGAPLPATNTDYDGAEIYLVSKDTGAAHNIGGYRYTYSGGTYVLYAGYYGGKVLAGTYDVLYRRYWDSQYNTVSRTTSDKAHVAGYRLLASNVAIAPGSNTLDLDIPVSTVTGTITLGGAALPPTNTDYDGAEIYLVSKDTGAAHDIGGYRYTYSGGTYVLYAGYYGGKVLAGTYDVLYRRYWDSQYDTVSRTTVDKTHVAGYRLLQTNVQIPTGATTLNLDIPVSTVGGTITLAGAPLPATNTDYDGAEIYLVAKDTGAAHDIGGYRYTYSGGTYVLYAGYYGGKVLSGSYDVLYRRYWDSSFNTVSRTTLDKTHVAGYRLLGSCQTVQ